MKKILVHAILALAILQYGCLKGPDYDKLSTNFVVVTNTDSLAHFSSYNTYYIPDSVAIVNGGALDTIRNDEYTKKLVDAVKQNMAARGYTLVPKGANPDLGVMMGVAKNTYVGVVYSGWWDYYYGWWDPYYYWGWYYPYYYPYATYYSVTTGTVIITMADLKNAKTSQVLRILWTGVAGGAVGDNLNTNVQRGVDAINQAFIQSPLVTKN